MSKVFTPLYIEKSVTIVNDYILYELKEIKTSDMKTAALKQKTLKQKLTYLLRTISTQGFTQAFT
jgi:hypothetical protein